MLAAGTSSRMGNFKPLLPIEGVPMLETVLTKVLSFPFQEVMAVVGYKEKEIRETIHIKDERFKWIVNQDYLEGLSSSIKAAIHQYNNQSRGILIFLGDQPLLKESTIDQLIQVILNMGYDQSKAVVQPTFEGIPGHPVFISAQMIPYLNMISGDQGAKPMFKMAEKHIHISLNDQGTIIDVDTPQDYQDIVSLP